MKLPRLTFDSRLVSAVLIIAIRPVTPYAHANG